MVRMYVTPRGKGKRGEKTLRKHMQSPRCPYSTLLLLLGEAVMTTGPRQQSHGRIIEGHV